MADHLLLCKCWVTVFADEITLRSIGLENADILVFVGIIETIVQVATLAKAAHEKNPL